MRHAILRPPGNVLGSPEDTPPANTRLAIVECACIYPRCTCGIDSRIRLALIVRGLVRVAQPAREEPRVEGAAEGSVMVGVQTVRSLLGEAERVRKRIDECVRRRDRVRRGAWVEFWDRRIFEAQRTRERIERALRESWTA
jgi:hypothetical protein